MPLGAWRMPAADELRSASCRLPLLGGGYPAQVRPISPVTTSRLDTRGVPVAAGGWRGRSASSGSRRKPAAVDGVTVAVGDGLSRVGPASSPPPPPAMLVCSVACRGSVSGAVSRSRAAGSRSGYILYKASHLPRALSCLVTSTRPDTLSREGIGAADASHCGVGARRRRRPRPSIVGKSLFTTPVSWSRQRGHQGV